MDKIENYSQHRTKFVTKGRGTAFMTAVHQMDEFISHPDTFQSNALANRVQIKTERDVEKQLNIKQEKVDVLKRSAKATKRQKNSTGAWQQEKQNLVQQIVSLKSANHKIHLELTNKQSECASLSQKNQELERQIGVRISESDALKKTISAMLADQATKNTQNEKINSDLRREKELLEALNKQLQTGIDQHVELKNKQNGSSDEYSVESILGQKKKNGIWFYKIRWEGFGPEHDSWEKESNLHCPQILEAFKQSVAKK